jgi:hypothetical protein
VRRGLPLVAGVLAVGVVVLLVVTGGGATSPDGRDPASTVPGSTTSTTRPPLRRFAAVALAPTGDVYDSYRLRTVRDLQLGRAVTQLHRTGGDLVGAALYADVARPAATRWRLTVRMRVVGDGSAHLSLLAVPRGDPAAGGPAADPPGVETPADQHVRAGGWEERTLELDVPPDARRLVYYVIVEGTGDLLVDTARLATVAAS